MTRTLTVKVTDRRGKYPAKTYQIDVDDTISASDQQLTAYARACETFIKDNGHRARGPSERMSSYYGRFWNEVIKPD